jgi:hypothetical protein
MTIEQSTPDGVEISQPGSLPAARQSASHINNLAIVLERLWKFYEAMRSGKPLSDSGQMLAQIGTALSNSATTGHAICPEESRAAQQKDGNKPNALAGDPWPAQPQS